MQFVYHLGMFFFGRRSCEANYHQMLPCRYVTSSEKFINKIVEATGWGATEFSGRLSTTLQKLKLNVISNQQCSQAYPDGISTTQLCTYTVDKDTCQVT